MRRVDKRRWACTNMKCLMSQEMSAALCQEVPGDGKCLICQSDILILEEPVGAAENLAEFALDWKCAGCDQGGLLEPGERPPQKCSKCGSIEILIPPVKKDGPFGPGLLREH